MSDLLQLLRLVFGQLKSTHSTPTSVYRKVTRARAVGFMFCVGFQSDSSIGGLLPSSSQVPIKRVIDSGQFG